MSAIADALASGGTYLKWEHPGTTYTGIITDVTMRQSRKYESTELDAWDDGTPKMQVVLTLATDYRDQGQQDDDGTRMVSINLWSGQKKALVGVQSGWRLRADRRAAIHRDARRRDRQRESTTRLRVHPPGGSDWGRSRPRSRGDRSTRSTCGGESGRDGEAAPRSRTLHPGSSNRIRPPGDRRRRPREHDGTLLTQWAAVRGGG